MSVWDHLFALVLIAVYPLYTWWSMRRLKPALAGGPHAARLQMYRSGQWELWGLMTLVLLLAVTQGRDWSALGLGMPHPLWGPVLLLVVLVIIAFMRRSLRGFPADEQQACSVRDTMKDVLFMLPADARELSGYRRISLAAGICEEIVYRGFLTLWFGQWFSLLPAVLLANLCFGFAHIYLGLHSVIRSAFLGLLFAGMVWLTESLWVAMLLHAYIDWHSGDVARALWPQRET